MPDGAQKKPSRIQQRNRRMILDAALNVFSQHGFRGSTLDQIAAEAGLSKPNILYYFQGKEDIHLTLLSQLMETWLDPLVALDPSGDPQTEILDYVQRKLDMARDLPRESRLFAGEFFRARRAWHRILKATSSHCLMKNVELFPAGSRRKNFATGPSAPYIFNLGSDPALC